MLSNWTKGLEKEKADELRKAFNKLPPTVKKRLIEVLTGWRDENRDFFNSRNNYSDPGWERKAADASGVDRTIKFMIDLFTK